MTIEEFFGTIGGNYDDVISRLPSESMINKFLHKFLDDPSFNQLKTAFEENDVKSAFLAAHTLKGTAATLGLTSLGNAASELTELLRNASSLPDITRFQEVENAYNITIYNIAMLD